MRLIPRNYPKKEESERKKNGRQNLDLGRSRQAIIKSECSGFLTGRCVRSSSLSFVLVPFPGPRGLSEAIK